MAPPQPPKILLTCLPATLAVLLLWTHTEFLGVEEHRHEQPGEGAAGILCWGSFPREAVPGVFPLVSAPARLPVCLPTGACQYFL